MGTLQGDLIMSTKGGGRRTTPNELINLEMSTQVSTFTISLVLITDTVQN